MNNTLGMSRRHVCESGNAFHGFARPIAESPDARTFTAAIIRRTDELLQRLKNPELQHTATPRPT
jgi:hypothetical protein